MLGNSLEEDIQITFVHGLAGSTAALLSTTFLYPLENIKTRMQVIRTKPKKRNSRQLRGSIEQNLIGHGDKSISVRSLDRYRRSLTFNISDGDMYIDKPNSPMKLSPKRNSFDKSLTNSKERMLPDPPKDQSKSPVKDGEISPFVEKNPSPLDLTKRAPKRTGGKTKAGTAINPKLSIKVDNPFLRGRSRQRANSLLLTGRFHLQASENEKPPEEKIEEEKRMPLKRTNLKRTLTNILPSVTESPKKIDAGEEKTSQKSDEIQKPSNENSSILDVFREVAKKEGIQGLYRGITPLLIGNFISYGVYFFWYEALKKYWKIRTNDILGYSKIAFFSGIITTTCSHPFWVINAKMTLQKENQGIWQVISKILDNEGVPGFFKGLWTSLTMILNPIIQFSIYEYIKNALKDSKNQTLVYFFGGAVSKALATIFTYPYQLIRTNIHVNYPFDLFYCDSILKPQISNQNVLSKEILKEIYNNGGFKAFFKGLSPKLFQTVLNSAFLLLFYEKIFYLFLILSFKPERNRLLKN